MVTNYDFKANTVLVGGVVITGFADGTAIECTKNEDNFKTSIGAAGDVTFCESNDETGSIKITLKPTSPSCPYLDGLASKKGEAATTTASVVSAYTNASNVSGTKCRVMKPADKKEAPEEQAREYNIFVADYTVKANA